MCIALSLHQHEELGRQHDNNMLTVLTVPVLVGKDDVSKEITHVSVDADADC